MVLGRIAGFGNETAIAGVASSLQYGVAEVRCAAVQALSYVAKVNDVTVHSVNVSN